MKYFITALFVLCLTLTAQAQDQTVSLRPEFVEGQTRLYEEWTRYTTDTRVVFPGGTRENHQTETATFTSEVEWTVIDTKPSGQATVKVTVNWVELEVNGTSNDQTMTMKVDTRKPSTEHKQYHELLKEVIDNPITYTFKPDGTVDKVEGTKKLKLRAEMVSPERINTEAIYGVAAMGQPGNIPETLSLNDSWKQELLGYAFEANETKIPVTYTLTEITNIEGVPVAVVNAQATPILLDPDFGEMPPNAPKPTFKPGKTSYESEIFFDLDKNEVTARNLQQSQAYTLLLTAPNNQVLTVNRSENIEGQTLRLETQNDN